MVIKMIKKYAIILDTNSFGDINKYNFIESKMTICINSFSNITNINVFMPSIVYNELKKHIKDSIKNSVKEIKSNYLKKAISESDVEKIYKKNVGLLDNFIEKQKVIIYDCIEYANLEEIIDWYFNQEMPFEPSKPKEFPDAIIISSAIKYFEENNYDEVIAISHDIGFSKGIEIHTKFRVESDIVNIMQELLNIKDTEIWNCKGYIMRHNILDNINTYKIKSCDENDYFDVSDIKTTVNNFKIISKEECSYLVCVNCNLELKGDFEIVDQDMTVYDNEDAECSAIFYAQGNTINVKDFNVFISLSFNEQNKITEYEIVDVDSINLSEYVNQLTPVY